LFVVYENFKNIELFQVTNSQNINASVTNTSMYSGKVYIIVLRYK